MPAVKNDDLIVREFTIKRMQVDKPLIILSELWTTKEHFIEYDAHGTKINKSVLYVGDDSEAVKNGFQVNEKWYYYGIMDGEKCIISMPPSVGYAINKALKHPEVIAKYGENPSKRQFVWVASKTGAGKETRYAAKIAGEAPTLSAQDLEVNTNAFNSYMADYESLLKRRYFEVFATETKTTTDNLTEPVTDEEDVMDEHVDVTTIPFI